MSITNAHEHLDGGQRLPIAAPVGGGLSQVLQAILDDL